MDELRMRIPWKVDINPDKRGGEIVADLSITHNGNQWSTIRLYNQTEIDDVIKALQNCRIFKTGTDAPKELR